MAFVQCSRRFGAQRKTRSRSPLPAASRGGAICLRVLLRAQRAAPQKGPRDCGSLRGAPNDRLCRLAPLVVLVAARKWATAADAPVGSGMPARTAPTRSPGQPIHAVATQSGRKSDRICSRETKQRAAFSADVLSASTQKPSERASFHLGGDDARASVKAALEPLVRFW